MLNNDVEVIDGCWLREMLSLAVQPGVGIVGAKLYYPDNTVQHGGVIVGLGGYAGQPQIRPAGQLGLHVPSVHGAGPLCGLAACLLCKASVYDEVNGLDEAFTVAYNDVDFCLRVRDKGYRILYTPYAQLYHHESKSRGLDTKGPARSALTKRRSAWRSATAQA